MALLGALFRLVLCLELLTAFGRAAPSHGRQAATSGVVTLSGRQQAGVRRGGSGSTTERQRHRALAGTHTPGSQAARALAVHLSSEQPG